ncbi:MAG TPA: hypothetical protein VL614_22415 [Acetobacteraceae bacterium]|nr:hypothetical protein [Acetobacteraceae bacterium]
MPQQHIEEDAIIGDPQIDNFAAQLPYVSVSEYFYPVIAVASGISPDQHAIHLRRILHSSGPPLRDRLIG